MFSRKKGKILKIKTGYNPNSSSIGTNLTPLLIAGSLLSIAMPFLSIYISRRIKKKKSEEESG
ncbi:MAG: hypothetical protein GY754_11100 [bacterium]|nr:hypothetical protein [bacterium]